MQGVQRTKCCPTMPAEVCVSQRDCWRVTACLQVAMAVELVKHQITSHADGPTLAAQMMLIGQQHLLRSRVHVAE